MAKVIGIDLGTTYSAMAVVEGGASKVIENSEGGRTTPSVVAFSKTGEIIVGQLAKRQAITNPVNTIYGIKRLMGHRLDEPEISKWSKDVSYKIEAGPDGGAVVRLSDKTYRPEEISAMILQKLKRDAEAKLGETISEAVITCPAYFNDAQRQATKAAGEIAGFKVRRIINEPTAAALAYGFNKRKNEKIAVFDFGGGTFDVSILEVGDDVIEVKATDGDSHLGGEDIDRKIIDWIIQEFKKDSGIDIGKDLLALQRLKEAAEKTKHELSETLESEINIPFVTSDGSGPKHLLMKMTRSELEKLSADFINRAMVITKRTMEASAFKISEIDQVILVGGQTRMPAIQKAVRDFFGKEPNRSINPDEVVADGAAIQAGILQGDVRDVLLLDVTPLSLGIETLGGIATKLISKNTTVPVSKAQVFSTAADNQTSVEIHVVQGEREMAADNRTLGRFILDGITPSRRGLPQIEVAFDIDANGILNVKARDKSTAKEQSIKIEASSGLSKDDIEKMRKDAELNAQEDKRQREVVELRNNADNLIASAEKSLREHGDKISADLKNSINQKIDELKKAREGSDANLIKTASEALSKELSQIGQTK